MRCLLVATAAISLTATSVLAQDCVELEPYSDWVLNYDDDSCALQRQFGEEGRQVFFQLQAFGPKADLEVIVGSDSLDLGSGPISVAWDPGIDELLTVPVAFDLTMGSGYEGKLFAVSAVGQPAEYQREWEQWLASTSALAEEDRETLLEIVGLNPASRRAQRLFRDADFADASRRAFGIFRLTPTYQASREAAERRAEGLYLTNAFEEPIVLRTGSMHPPMDALRDCLDELQSHWGIDVAAHKELTREVEPKDMDRWVRRVQENYPFDMLTRGLQGYLRTRLDISEEGDVTGCHLQTDINHEEFERIACNNLFRAQFNPALDAQGQPISSYYQIAVVYSTR